ncbi:Zinc finger protein with KRAB and SCAN domains 7, partial [Pterocles gutturalis]
CPERGETFGQSSGFIAHQQIRTGERPFPCSHCERSFSYSSSLTVHLLTHTGEKPYICPLCARAF